MSLNIVGKLKEDQCTVESVDIFNSLGRIFITLTYTLTSLLCITLLIKAGHRVSLFIHIQLHVAAFIGDFPLILPFLIFSHISSTPQY